MASIAEKGGAESRTLGVLLLLGSAVFFALAGILTKAIASDVWTITCWRGLVGGAIIGLYMLWRRQTRSGTASLRLGWRGWLLAFTGGVASILIISAFKLTYVANVAFIYATIPFVAAVVGWVAIREGVRRRTLLAACVSLAGVAVVVSGGLGSGNMLGDAVAVGLTVICAIYMVMIRAFRDTPVVWAAGVSAFGLFIATMPLADHASVTRADAVLIVLFGVTYAFSLILWTEGTRLIPASEAGLIGCAELPLAVLFAGLLLAEWPPVASLVGGAIVLAAVFVHAGLDLAQGRATAAARARRGPG